MHPRLCLFFYSPLTEHGGRILSSHRKALSILVTQPYSLLRLRLAFVRDRLALIFKRLITPLELNSTKVGALDLGVG